MEAIRGKHAVGVDASTLTRLGAGYPHILVDLGTGDGRFVRHVAATWPGYYAIGIDLCRTPLREASRSAPANALYLIASAYTLPRELVGCATHLTINFPWGDLLTGLLRGDTVLLAQLAGVTRPGARIEVRVNGGALAEAGCSPAAAGTQIRHALHLAGFAVEPPRLLGVPELRAYPSTWAHRLAFGRDPRALYLVGRRAGAPPAFDREPRFMVE